MTPGSDGSVVAVDLERRSFLRAASVTTSAALASALAPCSLLEALATPAPALAVSASAAECMREWHIDDAWGHTPRYAHPIPYAPARAPHIAWERVDPIDHLYVI